MISICVSRMPLACSGSGVNDQLSWSHVRKAKIGVRVAVNLDCRIEIVAARKLLLQEHFITHQLERLDPANAVFSTHEQLKSSVRDATRLTKLCGEPGGRVFKNCRRR